MNRKISLKWQRPYDFEELILGLYKRNELYSAFNRPGVYLHTEDVNVDDDDKEVEIITYVGKSQSSLIHRQLEHYRHYIGGLCSIPFYRKELNKSWVPPEESWVPSEKKCNYIKAITDIEKFKEIVCAGYNYAESIKIYFCTDPTTDPPDPPLDLNLLERQLLYKIKPLLTYRGTATAPQEEYEFDHGGVLAGKESLFTQNNEETIKPLREKIKGQLT